MNTPQDPLAELIRAAGHRPEPSAEVMGRLRAGAHAQWQAGLRERRRRRLFAVAAGVAVLGFGALLLSVGRFSEAPSIVARLTQAGDHQIVRARPDADVLDSDLLGVGDELRTPASTGITLAQLPQGTTSLRLAPATRLRWKSAERVELLAGAIYIDTSHGAPGARAGDATANPLVIEIGAARIEHIGTQFMVTRRDDRTEVRVRDGMVRVTLGDESRRLVRGEAALVPSSGEGTIETERGAASGIVWQWVDGLAPRVPIEGRDLLTVLKTLAYEAGLELRFARPGVEATARGTTLHGPSLDLPPRDAMRAVLASSDLFIADETRADDGTVLIDSR